MWTVHLCGCCTLSATGQTGLQSVNTSPWETRARPLAPASGRWPPATHAPCLGPSRNAPDPGSPGRMQAAGRVSCLLQRALLDENAALFPRTPALRWLRSELFPLCPSGFQGVTSLLCLQIRFLSAELQFPSEKM